MYMAYECEWQSHMPWDICLQVYLSPQCSVLLKHGSMGYTLTAGPAAKQREAQCAQLQVWRHGPLCIAREGEGTVIGIVHWMDVYWWSRSAGTFHACCGAGIKVELTEVTGITLWPWKQACMRSWQELSSPCMDCSAAFLSGSTQLMQHMHRTWHMAHSTLLFALRAMPFLLRHS